MGKNKRFISLDSVSSTGTGESRKTAGHPHLGLFVVAESLDAANDTLTVRGEVSHNDEDFAQIDIGTTGQEDVLTVDQTDFVESDQNPGRFVAYVTAYNVPVEHLRANVTDFTDAANGDLSVTAYLYLTGWTGHGKSYEERTDLASQV